MPKNLSNGSQLSWDDIKKMKLVGRTIEILQFSSDNGDMPHTFIRAVISSVKWDQWGGKMPELILIEDARERTADDSGTTEWERTDEFQIECRDSETVQAGTLSPWMDDGKVIWFRTPDGCEVVIYNDELDVMILPFLHRNFDEWEEYQRQLSEKISRENEPHQELAAV